MQKLKINELSEEALMEAYQVGEMAAFNELYLRHNGRVKGYFIKRGGTTVDAEDFCQRVFIKLHESKNLYHSHLPFFAWFFVLVKNLWIDFLRSKNSLNKIDLKETVGELEKNDFKNQEPSLPSCEDTLAVREWLSSILKGLTQEEEELLVLKFGLEHSYKEIAGMTGNSEVSLRKKTSRLLRALQLKNKDI